MFEFLPACVFSHLREEPHLQKVNKMYSFVTLVSWVVEKTSIKVPIDLISGSLQRAGIGNWKKLRPCCQFVTICLLTNTTIHGVVNHTLLHNMLRATWFLKMCTLSRNLRSAECQLRWRIPDSKTVAQAPCKKKIDPARLINTTFEICSTLFEQTSKLCVFCRHCADF